MDTSSGTRRSRQVDQAGEQAGASGPGLSDTRTQTTHDRSHRHASLAESVTALSMTIGRGTAARVVADAADIEDGDRVVDVGCGPGTALRLACRRGATGTGVDPSSQMLRLARRISALRRAHGLSFVEGSAESLPIPDESASVVWALSSLHHWQDRARGLAEARRVLAPCGRLLLAERLVAPGARGHARHGLSSEAAEDVVRAVAQAGFVEVRRDVRTAGHRTLVVVAASAPGAPPG